MTQHIMTQQSTSKKILYVEDSEILQKLMVLVLKQYEVTAALTSKQALEKLETEYFDCFILDIHLSDGDNGVNLCKAIRQYKQYEKTPIIALTAIQKKDILKHIHPGGFDDYICKPFDPNDVIHMISFFCHISAKSVSAESNSPKLVPYKHE